MVIFQVGVKTDAEDTNVSSNWKALHVFPVIWVFLFMF